MELALELLVQEVVIVAVVDYAILAVEHQQLLQRIHHVTAHVIQHAMEVVKVVLEDVLECVLLVLEIVIIAVADVLDVVQLVIAVQDAKEDVQELV